ncbi:MAG: 6-carboxytetrahydropterin synthase [Planctomycetota bacterium]
MFEVSTIREFAAAHAITMKGLREPVHGHNWRVTVTVAGPVLDSDGLLVDFHDLERRLENVIRPFHNQNLNDVEPFDEINPTAEHVAKYIAETLFRTMPAPVDSLTAAVTEAPGCEARYRVVKRSDK